MASADSFLPPVVVEITATDKAFVAKLAEDKALLLDFAKQVTNARIGIDSAQLQTDLLGLKTEMLAFAQELKNAKLGLDAVPFWTEMAQLRSEVQALSPLDVKVDVHIADALAKLAVLKEDLKSAQLGAMMTPDLGLINANIARMFGAGGGTGGAAGGAASGAAAAAGGFMTFVHIAHLFTPEIVGFATALFSVGAGFAALGVASIGAVSDIYQGTTAVGNATNAIAAAIPGTTQWTQGVGQLGQAWSAIPTALQPAVSGIRKILAGFGNSPMAGEIQGFLGAQVGTIGSLLGSGGSTFAPLILATQRAMQTVEGIIKHAMGSGALTNLVSGLAKMVGPATVELVQMGGALVKIGAGFAKAVQDGKGMEMLVTLLRSIAQVVNSSLFSGFIAGWVDFDRLLSTALGLLAKGIGYLSSFGTNLNGLGTVLGFVVSGLLAVKSTIYLVGLMAGTQAKAGLAQFGSTMTGVITKAAGLGLIAVGITGLVGNITSLLHVSNPLTHLWNDLAGLFGKVSKAAGSSIDTISGYKLQLSGAIHVTGRLSSAMDLLVRSEQSIGSSLGGLVQGFRPLTLTALGAGTAVSKVTDSVNTLISTLQGKNQSLATWAADAQILIKRGMDPSAVASLAQQAPQDLASMSTATTAQLQSMNVQWQEQMLLAQMSGQNGVNGFVSALKNGLANGTPTVKAAAAQLASQLGKTLNVPFTGTKKSIDAIGTALNQVPKSVLATLAGKTHQYSAAANDAASATKKVGSASKSNLGPILSMAGNLAMVAGGLMLVGGSFDIAAGAAALFGGAMAIVTSPITLIVAAIALVGVGLYELVKHWGTVSAVLTSTWRSVWGSLTTFLRPAIKAVQGVLHSFMSWFHSYSGEIDTVGHYIATFFSVAWHDASEYVVGAWHVIHAVVVAGLHAVEATVKAVLPHLKSIFHSGWELISGVVTTAWNIISSTVKVAFDLVKGIVEVGLDLLTGHWSRAWNDMLATIKSIWGAAMSFLGKVPGEIVGVFAGAGKLLWNIGSAIISGLWGGMKSIWHSVTGWLGGLASKIANLKGPISVDAVLLVPHGNAIMAGLGEGLKQGYLSKVLPLVSSIAGQINQTMVGAGTPRLPGAAGMTGMGMGTSLEVHATFQIIAPGGNPEAIKSVISSGAAQEFAHQVLVSMQSGAGSVY